MLNNIKNLYNDKSGFNLAEVLVAITVLVVAITAIMDLIISNINVQSKNEDYLVASMLSQEGIELVRNVRDRNWLFEISPSRSPWEKIYDPSDNDFTIDIRMDSDAVNYPNYPNITSTVNDADHSDITDTPGAQLYYSGYGTGIYYDHDNTGLASKFYRLIVVDGYDPVTENIQITSIVQWRNKGSLNSYKTSAYLYDWR